MRSARSLPPDSEPCQPLAVAKTCRQRKIDCVWAKSFSNLRPTSTTTFTATVSGTPQALTLPHLEDLREIADVSAENEEWQNAGLADLRDLADSKRRQHAGEEETDEGYLEYEENLCAAVLSELKRPSGAKAETDEESQ